MLTSSNGPMPIQELTWDNGEKSIVIRVGAHTWPTEIQVRLSPYLMDLSGNWMDQNRNGAQGEDPEDAYTFTLSEILAYTKPWPIRTTAGFMNIGPEGRHAAVDWDNDGDTDILAGLRTGEVMLYLNEGNSRSNYFRYPPRPVLAGGSVIQIQQGIVYLACVDLTGDGLRDIVVEEDAWPYQARLYRNTGTPSAPAFAASVYLTDTNGAPVQMKGTYFDVADWDSDGLRDFVAADWWGYFFWFRNIGAASAPQFALPELIADADRLTFHPHIPRPFVFDANGDGRRDLMFATWDGIRFVINHSGSPALSGDQFANAYRHDGFGLSFPSGAIPSLADFNGDGLPDLVCSQGWGQMYVSYTATNGQVDLLGPRVWAVYWQHEPYRDLWRLDVRFDERLLPGSVTTNQFLLTGPDGPVAITNLVVENAYAYIFLYPQSQGHKPGTYQLSIGPDIRDQAGNKMDQNANMTQGEMPGDVDVFTHVQPELRLSVRKLAGGKVEVSWPADATGFLLESTGALPPPPALPMWSVVTNAPTVSGDRLVVTLEMQTGPVFFRLRQ